MLQTTSSWELRWWRAAARCFSARATARLLQNPVERSQFVCLFQKQPDGFLEVLERTLLGAAARGNIELARMRHVGSALFEDLGGELNLHTSMVDDEGREV